MRHPNVLVVHGADVHEGRVGLWTDLLEGKTLEKCLEEQGAFSAQEAALIGIDLCRALAAVHGAGLVHRDVKTSNVMREKGGRIVLTDFGSGSPYGEAEPDARSRTRSGTPLAMAPEVLLRGEPPRPSADIYGLGVLIYRLVSARYPIEARTLAELQQRHEAGGMTPLSDARPDLPGAFVQVVERALSPDPKQRYASVGQMEQALSASLGQPVREPTPQPAPRSPARWIAVAAAAVLLAGLVLIGRQWMAPGPFTVEAALFRTGTGGVEERLQPGSVVQPGDRLSMELRGSAPLHVYVLNEDTSGEIYVLFPAGIDLENPLPAGVTHRLPGRLAGVPQHWIVTSAGQRETLLVIASRAPLPDLERELADLPKAEPGRPIAYRKVTDQGREDLLRSIGGLGGPPQDAPGAPDASPGRLTAIAQALDAREETSSGIWVRQIHLENPEP